MGSLIFILLISYKDPKPPIGFASIDLFFFLTDLEDNLIYDLPIY